MNTHTKRKQTHVFGSEAGKKENKKAHFQIFDHASSLGLRPPKD